MCDTNTKDIVYKLLNDGVKLSDIQDILKNGHSINMTFLDLRLLAAELENVNWGQHDPVAEEPEEEAQVQLEGDGTTTVEISKLVRPGSVANGSVKFASGATADWMLSQMGQLGLDNNVGEPTPEDLEDFKVELQQVLAQGGF